MSYSLSISGHKETGGAEESKEFEAETIKLAKEFVSKLEGVVSAGGNFGHTGYVDLLDENKAG